jgi:hypothetical protein
LVRHLLARGCGGIVSDAPLDLEEQMACEYIINWSNFKLRGAAPFFMADPFKTYVQDVRNHIAAR